jgi:ketosteroid isomerase-like protein
MPKEPTRPDLVDLTRQSMEATNRGDLDASATLFAPDAVFDVSSAGLGRFEGLTAIHGYLADWTSAYETQEMRQWEGWHLGNGVVFVVTVFEARPLGSQATVREQWAFTVIWARGMISRVVASRDTRAARTAAERLAGERGG